MLLKFTYLQCFASLGIAGVAFGYISLVITLIAVACSQFEKLKASILDTRMEHMTLRHGQEVEQDNAITNSDLQAKLNTCIRHHQDIIE